jgi:uncharacterized protein (DUF697 family)/uncharacterized tellurite resistance protein B-like protein
MQTTSSAPSTSQPPPLLSSTERDAIASICLFAAFADGAQNVAEQDKLASVLRELGEVPGSVFQDVLLRRTTIAEQAAKLTTPDTSDAVRRLAFDMAVGMCDCDGAMSVAERDVLFALAKALNLPAASVQQSTSEAEQVASAATATPEVVGNVPAGESATRLVSPTADSEADSVVLKYAITNAALELLPQSLASMAIVPLQMRMVYRVGSLYGYSLDKGHIKDFVATAGVGVTSQVLESYARKFFGALTGRTLGRTAGKVVEKVSGPTITFASTYALGQVAKVYYANGRKLSLDDLRAMVGKQTESAKGLYMQYEPQVRSTAKNLTPTSVMSMLRGA